MTLWRVRPYGNNQLGSITIKILPPQPLSSQHDCSGFSSGIDALDSWFRDKAQKNQTARATRTYVVCSEDGNIVGYFSLAAGAVRHQISTGKARRNMPDPIPAVILARLAVHQNFQGNGIGHSMLKDAVARVLQSAESIGVRVMLVHALDENAKNFYKYFGFKSSPIEEMTLMATLDDLKASASSA